MFMSPGPKRKRDIGLGEGRLPAFSMSKINISLISVIHGPLALTSPGFLLKMQNPGSTPVSLTQNFRGKGPRFLYFSKSPS